MSPTRRLPMADNPNIPALTQQLSATAASIDAMTDRIVIAEGLATELRGASKRIKQVLVALAVMVILGPYFVFGVTRAVGRANCVRINQVRELERDLWLPVLEKRLAIPDLPKKDREEAEAFQTRL